MLKIVASAVLLFSLAGCIVVTTPQPKAEVPIKNVKPIDVAPVKSSNVRIYFQEDSSALSAEAQASLMTYAGNHQVLGPSFKVIGYADEAGTREYNLSLGAQRAASVRDFLVANGVAISRITISTRGQEMPVVACGNSKCAPENRRVEIIVQN